MENNEQQKTNKKYKTIDRDLVYKLACIQCSDQEIAEVVGTTATNLRKRFASLLEKGKQEGKKYCIGCCDFFEQTISNIDTTFYCINNGNSIYSILYTSFGDNQTKTAIKAITTSSFDTTELYISY